MTELHFEKWQATGNDFIIADNRDGSLNRLSTDQIALLCHRKFGVGSDGFMYISQDPDYDFEMHYFNSDGRKAEMCGNGARSIIAFCHELGIISENTTFRAADGIHEGSVLSQDRYRIKMKDVSRIERISFADFDLNEIVPLSPNAYYLNTGVPHLVLLTREPTDSQIVAQGRRIRFSERFHPDGTNVNFVHTDGRQLFVRTYERGVENETLSCGTGAVASALATRLQEVSPDEFRASVDRVSDIHVKGGRLRVLFTQTGPENFEHIYLEGPAERVFKGQVRI